MLGLSRRDGAPAWRDPPSAAPKKERLLEARPGMVRLCHDAAGRRGSLLAAGCGSACGYTGLTGQFWRFGRRDCERRTKNRQGGEVCLRG